MRYYCASQPDVRGYKKRMHQIWMTKFPQSIVNEQRLVNQRLVIQRSTLLTAVEQEEIHCQLQGRKEEIIKLSEETQTVEQTIASTQTNVQQASTNMLNNK